MNGLDKSNQVSESLTEKNIRELKLQQSLNFDVEMMANFQVFKSETMNAIERMNKRVEADQNTIDIQKQLNAFKEDMMLFGGKNDSLEVELNDTNQRIR